jgi:hypothetical protein
VIVHAVRRRLVVALVAAMTLAGCALGERPYFEDDPLAGGIPTGDEKIDAVLALFDQAKDDTPFVAVYTSVVRFDTSEHAATVASDGTRRSVTIDQVRFLSESGFVQTCELSNRLCTTGQLSERVSNTLLTPDFWADDAARRLRRDAQAKLGPTAAYESDIAGQVASCVDVTVVGGVATYCALTNGVLAKLVDGDILVDLISYGTTPDPLLFSTG